MTGREHAYWRSLVARELSDFLCGWDRERFRRYFLDEAAYLDFCTLIARWFIVRNSELALLPEECICTCGAKYDVGRHCTCEAEQ